MIFLKQTRVLVFITTWIFIVTQTSCSLNLGLISGDHRRLTSPIVIKKVLRHSPITINVNTVKSPLKLTSPLTSPKLPSELFPLKSKLRPLTKLKPIKSKLIKIPKVPKIPKLPKLPLLPLPLLPILPPLPLLPLPILPRLPKPLKISTLKRKTALEKALGTNIKPVIKIPSKLNKNILKTLLDLKKRGSLTTAEFLRFKKLLVK
ncbi:uncharacterized protein LOC123700503 [Colias croceus]|uniref:uncharacterized protein LOC123700503 n=1 Tax=Colias crocea TaxID=72248 RepID=UPI001E27BF29|nr:uncharacterized protein LOC123700503 [Colias croceus]